MMYLGNEKVSIVDIIEKKFNFTSLNNGGFVRYNEALDAFDTVLPDDQLNALSDNVVKNSVVTLELAQKANRDELPDVSQFITKDVNNLINYTTTEELVVLLEDKIDEKLVDYVKNTDYATYEKAGVVRVASSYGLKMGSNGALIINKASEEEISSKTNNNNPIVPSNLDLAVKAGVTTNTIELTEEEKTAVSEWLGTLKKGATNQVQLADGTTMSWAYNTSPNSLVRREGQGRIFTNTPTEDLHAANKRYVDDKFNGSNKAVSFVNYSAMISSLNALANTSYSVGQNIMIVTLAVPDLWVSEIAEESVAYTYVSDDDFVNALNTNGSVQVGYYKLSALETQKVDLTEYAKTSQVDEINTNLTENYVKNTDYASDSKVGVVKVSGYRGMQILTGGLITPKAATTTQIDNRHNTASEDVSRTTTVTLNNIDYAVKAGLTTNTETLTDEEKAAAQNWLGTFNKPKYTSGRRRFVGIGPDADGGSEIIVEMSGAAAIPTGYAVPVANNVGNIAVATPTENNHAANKKYVDDIAATIPTFTATQLEDGSYSLTIGG